MGGPDTLLTQLLFSYGTLQLPQVQLATFGRLLAGDADAIVGYRLAALRIGDPEVVATSGSDTHPVLVPDPDATAEVPGTALRITPEELAAADRYEVDEYARVEVPLRSGRTAWVYVLRSGTRTQHRSR